jgi:hypothetical protein
MGKSIDSRFFMRRRAPFVEPSQDELEAAIFERDEPAAAFGMAGLWGPQPANEDILELSHARRVSEGQRQQQAIFGEKRRQHDAKSAAERAARDHAFRRGLVKGMREGLAYGAFAGGLVVLAIALLLR